MTKKSKMVPHSTLIFIYQGNEAGNVSANNVEIGIGVGLAITSLAIMIGHVSGGHLNPAVTVGMIVGGRISIIQGLLYIVAQVLGGMCVCVCVCVCVCLCKCERMCE